MKIILQKIKKRLTPYPKWFNSDVKDYKKLAKSGEEIKLFPQLHDKTSTTDFDHQYVYQGPWAFEKIYRNKPTKHFDVGSQVNYLGFFSEICPTTFVDIRPTRAQFNNFTEVKGSILNLPFKSKSIESLSCLHVIEHIGLGRYGDKLDVNGSYNACKELQRVVAKNGNLYLTAPVGKEITYFNAHRVFNPATIIDYFDELELVSFNAIDDKGKLTYDASIKKAAGFEYGCGLFWLKRP